MPVTYLITSGIIETKNYSETFPKLLELIKVAIDCGVSMIQIREKKLSTGLLFKLTREIVVIAKDSKTKILINDRADIALAAKTCGIHLSSNSVPAKIIRQNFPNNFIIGVSTHNSAEVLKAKNDGANFAVFSPIYKTPEKGKPKGLNNLNKVIKMAGDFPIFSLGGINEINFAETLKAGASGIAAIRMFNEANKLPEIVGKINGTKYEKTTSLPDNSRC